jgi:hypothetical protein
LKSDLGVVGWLLERAGKMENVVKTMDEARGENPRAMFYRKLLQLAWNSKNKEIEEGNMSTE